MKLEQLISDYYHLSLKIQSLTLLYWLNPISDWLFADYFVPIIEDMSWINRSSALYIKDVYIIAIIVKTTCCLFI